MEYQLTMPRSTVFTAPGGRGGYLPFSSDNPDDPYWLSRGRHYSGDARCGMEWVAYIAGEEKSDHPKCVDNFLSEFFITLNDMCTDEQRQTLRPLLARCIGTAGDGVARQDIWDAHCLRFNVATGITFIDPPFTDQEMRFFFDVAEAMLPTVPLDLPVPVLERAREVCAL